MCVYIACMYMYTSVWVPLDLWNIRFILKPQAKICSFSLSVESTDWNPRNFIRDLGLTQYQTNMPKESASGVEVSWTPKSYPQKGAKSSTQCFSMRIVASK